MIGSLPLIIWFVIFIIFFSIDILRKDIFFIYLALASFASGVLSIFIEDIEIQIVVFIISSLVFTIFIKIIFDKMIEMNVKFTHKKYNEDKFCMILVRDNKDISLYKVISKSGIYTAKAINRKNTVKKYRIYNILHDDGKMLIIR